MDVPSIRYTRTTDGVEIAYTMFGSGPPLVIAESTMSAGLDLSIRSPQWMQRYETLASKRTVVLFDWRGLGASGAALHGFSVEGFETDLAAVVGVFPMAIDLAARVTLGQVAIAFAAAHPSQVRKLALIGLNTTGNSARTAPRARAIFHLAESDWPLFSELFALLQYGWTDIELARLTRERISERFNPELLDDLMTAVESLDSLERASELTMPTLVYQNQDMDARGIPALRKFVSEVPDARLFTGPTGAMAVGFEWAQTMLDFLEADPGTESTPTVSPGGFQTILFTDLEGSTALTQRLGDEGAQELLHGHNQAVRAALVEHGGREVKHTRDGIMASFPSAVSAVTAALQMQRDLAGGEVRVRIGLNAGEPIAEDDDLFGLSVIKAARIGDRAEPGQVLVSNVVRELCEGKTFTFTSIGDVTLKGFDEPVALYEVKV